MAKVNAIGVTWPAICRYCEIQHWWIAGFNFISTECGQLRWHSRAKYKLELVAECICILRSGQFPACSYWVADECNLDRVLLLCLAKAETHFYICVSLFIEGNWCGTDELSICPIYLPEPFRDFVLEIIVFATDGSKSVVFVLWNVIIFFFKRLFEPVGNPGARVFSLATPWDTDFLMPPSIQDENQFHTASAKPCFVPPSHFYVRSESLSFFLFHHVPPRYLSRVLFALVVTYYTCHNDNTNVSYVLNHLAVVHQRFNVCDK